MASPDAVFTAASLVAGLRACADPAAASRDAAALAALVARDEAAEAWLCEPAHARDAVHTLSCVLVSHSAQLDTEALAGVCTTVSIALESALDGDADDAVLQAACRGVCAACRFSGRDALSAAAGLVALLASVGTPATRDMLRAEAAPHVVAAMCLDAGVADNSAACVALHYLTQDGAALVVARLPGVGAALGAALSAAAEDEESGEAARAAAAALAHVAADAQCAALLAPAAAGAVVALETHAANAGCVRWLAAAVAKLADVGAAEARTPDACAAVARALALHRGVPALRAPLLAALVAAAAAEEQAATLLMSGATAPFALETRASGIAGAGSGLFVADGEVPAGAVVALYPGEVWAHAPPASVAAGNEYLAASPGGGFADGSPAAVARAAAAATARGAPELGARAAAHMANHPADGAAPNCFFLELALPHDALLRAPAAAPDGGAPPWVLCLLAAQTLTSGEEVTVDYRIDAARAPSWFAPVPDHLALL